MRQAKRIFYLVVLNIIVSAVTVIIVLNWWQNKHPTISENSTPVVIVVTATQSSALPLVVDTNGADGVLSTDTGLPITMTLKASPTFGLLSYRVKDGDILGALAVQFNVSVEDLLAVNGLSDPNSIYAGQIIYIPTAPLPTATLTPAPTKVSSVTPLPSTTVTPGLTPTSTFTPAGQEAQVTIDNVIGAGVLDSEKVRLLRSGAGELSLAGWRLEDGVGNVYKFPQLTLYKDGAINLNTRSGQDTVVDLYWGLNRPIWQSGKTASLYDGENQLRSTYTIP